MGTAHTSIPTMRPYQIPKPKGYIPAEVKENNIWILQAHRKLPKRCVFTSNLWNGRIHRMHTRQTIHSLPDNISHIRHDEKRRPFGEHSYTDASTAYHNSTHPTLSPTRPPMVLTKSVGSTRFFFIILIFFDASRSGSRHLYLKVNKTHPPFAACS